MAASAFDAERDTMSGAAWPPSDLSRSRAIARFPSEPRGRSAVSSGSLTHLAEPAVQVLADRVLLLGDPRQGGVVGGRHRVLEDERADGGSIAFDRSLGG